MSAIFMPRDVYGVIGWPLAQSLSPLLHNTGFQTLGIPGVYLRWEVAPEHLSRFLDAVRVLPVRGLSVTLPHKVAVMPLLDGLTREAEAVGAVNTLFWKDGALWGDNTDVAGFMAPLQPLCLPEETPVLLRGAGGAARAVAAGLTLAGFRHVRIATPSNTSHLPLAGRFGLEPVAWEARHDAPAGLVVNTTPLGMRGKHEGESPCDFARLPPAGAWALAYDIVYNPVRTAFVAGAEACGRRCVTGVEMFFGQGDAQFRRWTGRSLPAAARAALDSALRERACDEARG